MMLCSWFKSKNRADAARKHGAYPHGFYFSLTGKTLPDF